MKAWIQRSFRNRMFVTVLLIALVPLLLCDVLMMQLQVSRTEAEQTAQAAAALQELTQTCDRLWPEIESRVRLLADSTIVRSALRRGGRDSKTAYQLLNQTTQSYRQYADFSIYSAEGLCLYTTAALPGEALDPNWGVLHRAGQEKVPVLGLGAEDLLYGACAVRRHDGMVLGYVVFSMGQPQFDRLLSSGEVGDLLLVDSTWNAVWGTRPSEKDTMAQELKTRLMEGESLSDRQGVYRVYTVAWEGTGLRLVLLQPRAFTGRVLRMVYSLAVLMGVLCLCLCLLSAWILSRHMTRPISKLNGAMGQVERGNYDVQIRNDRKDELGSLSDSFNRMTQEYRSNLERSVRHQRELNETQIRMMQAQLNPHFLYNTLDTMKWLGLTHQAPEIASLATDLAKILRTSISEEELIPLEQELELIDRYLDIQLIRFRDSFACEIEVGEQFQRCLVPKLSLQPLVENAISHGVRDMEEGYIKLWAEQEGDCLLLRVSDNGAGIPAEVLQRLNSPDKRIPGGHLGLYNVDRIIRLHFGENYGLSAESEPGAGSRITLRLPILRKEEPIC